MTADEIPKMLSVRECARLTGVSYAQLLQICKDGKVAFIRTGKKYLVNVKSLSDYLNHGEGTLSNGLC